MLAFSVYGPSYVSANTVVGKEEALKFFPEGYVNIEAPEEEVEVDEEETTKKKRKSKTKLVENSEVGNEDDANVSTPETEKDENAEESPRQPPNEEI